MAKTKRELSFGDENWMYNSKTEKKLWADLPLSILPSGLKGKCFLEMGSGYGVYVYHVARKSARAFGIEIDPKRVKQSRKRLSEMKVKVNLKAGDIRQMPYKNNFFDIIFCHGVIEHFKNSEKGIEEGYRVLKKQGIAMYSVPARFSFFVPLKFLQIAIDKLFGTNMWRCGYEKSFTPWKFKRMLKDAGFKIKEFKISECPSGSRHPLVGKILRALDKPFWVAGLGGRFMFALCEKE